MFNITNIDPKDKKIYFDLSINGVNIRKCFIEKGNKGDWMLRLPTKKTEEGIEQLVWLNNKTFEKACKYVREYF